MNYISGATAAYFINDSFLACDDGHVALGDSVHRATHEWGLEDDIASDAAFGDDFRSWEVNFSRQKKEVVVGQPPVDAGVHEVCDGEAI